jgi:hypothetical protein
MLTARLTTRLEVPFKLLRRVFPEYAGPSEQSIQFEAGLQPKINLVDEINRLRREA